MSAGLDSFTRGQVCSGVVRRIEPFGVLVGLSGEVEGFIAVPELSWRHQRHVGDVVRVGQQIRAEVLDIDEVRGQVRLSLKATQEDPLPKLVALVGHAVTGPVTKITPLGAFVRIEDRPDGFEGLLPLADADDGASCEEAVHAVAEGDLIRLIVASVEIDRRRILLSPDNVRRDPADPM